MLLSSPRSDCIFQGSSGCIFDLSSLSFVVFVLVVLVHIFLLLSLLKYISRRRLRSLKVRKNLASFPLLFLFLRGFTELTYLVYIRRTEIVVGICISSSSSHSRTRCCPLRYQPEKPKARIRKEGQLKATGKLEFYASPPISPQSLWAINLDPALKDSTLSWDRSSGMDGDGQNFRHHDQPIYPSRFGLGRRAVSRQPNGGATDRFRQNGALPSARGDATMLSQATGSVQIPSSYVGYGYTDTSFQGSTQLQPYPQEQNPQPQQQQPTFGGYEQDVVYGLQQQGQTHDSFALVPQYPARQSAATIEALSSQFAVPQYFPAGEPTETGVGGLVSPYLNTQFPPPATYPQSSAPAQPFSTAMADLTNPLGAAAGQQQQSQPQPQQPQQAQQPQQPQPQPTAVATAQPEDAYSQYQRAIRVTLEHSRAGRLVEAGQSILEISEWIVTNAQQLGIFRDDSQIYPYQVRLWNDFNICWLSVCQMQKDLTQEIIQGGQQRPHVSLISAEYLEHMGKALIRLCDQVEEHGLVDYQIGFWEEEILSVVSQCLDLMESRPETWRAHPMAPPATAASRSRS